jgi:predicted PhzF superfamily epimerase YddE/YHI9
VSWPLYQVDAFTSEPFAGNPAAVCLLEDGEDPGWMQQVAAEMNLSETAFLRPAGAGTYGLRWFTPTVEVELCGHATLASAHVLWSEGLAGAGQAVRFDTASGALAARPGEDGTIWLDFPATPATPVDRPKACWTPSAAARRASSAWDASTTWSSWATRRPCAGWPPTSGAWTASAPAG